MADIDLTRSVSWAQPWRSDVPLWATEYVQPMSGLTQAHLLRASDGARYVTKFQNNPYKSRVLASEYLATRLGSWLGLPMPRVCVIDVPESLVNESLLRINNEDRLTRCASGRQLALRYIPDALDSIRRRLFVHLIRRAAALARERTGNSNAARMVMIAITTRSSINVKARDF